MDRPSLAALAGAAALHLAALWYLEFRAPALAAEGAIVDIGLLVLPELPRGFGEVAPYAFLAALVLRRGPGALGWFAVQAAGLMAARAVCVAATALPPTYGGCAPGPLAVLHGGCRDKVFSGHVAYMTLMALHLREGGGAGPGGIPWRQRKGALCADSALAAAVLAEATYLVAAREHYSIDVLVALLLAALTFRAFPAPPQGPAPASP